MTISPSPSASSKRIDRRTLLKGAAVLGGAAAMASLAACTAGASPASPSKVRKWDKEVDVVVVGTGTASLAALAAHDAGSKVVMLEKAPVYGGHTAVSGGGLYTPNHYILRAQGQNTRDNDLAYIRAVVAQAGNRANDEMLVRFVDTCNDTIDYFIKIGVNEWAASGKQYASYYPDSLPGHRKSATYLTYKGGGKGLQAAIKKQIDGRSIELLLETPGKRLIYEGDSSSGDGEVVGIVAQTPNGQEISIKARKGIIIGTGGFEHNKEMAEHFLRNPLYYKCSVPTNTGDGHSMCMAVGAQLRNMNEIWGYCGYNVTEDGAGIGDTAMYRGKPGAIVVNKHGERIGNEAAAYENFGRAFGTYDTGTMEWRNVPAYTIFSAEYTKRYGLPGAVPPQGQTSAVGVVPGFFKKGDTLEDLARQLGINVNGLMAQVKRFNENAKNGVDPEWHRGENSFDTQTGGDESRTDLKNPCLAPIETGPFYGAALWPGTMGGTCGGPLTNTNGQVLNVWGKPIPRLYVTGNTMASVTGGTYPCGGSTLGPGFTFSYIGGNHAAKLKSWDAKA